MKWAVTTNVLSQLGAFFDGASQSLLFTHFAFWVGNFRPRHSFV
jgi:hypothetical protein